MSFEKKVSMSSFLKIKALLPQLSNSEAKLATFTLENAQMIRSLSSVELAQAAGVSQSSVIKFSQKLGYKGFPTFKLAIIDDLNEQKQAQSEQKQAVSHADPLTELASNLVLSQQTILQDTLQLNQSAQFSDAINLIKSARKIVLCGIGNSYTIAYDFALKLQKVGLPAIAHLDEINASSYISTMNKDDLVIAISTSGESKTIVKLAEQAKSNHCKLLCLSRYGHSDLAALSDTHLYTAYEAEPVKHSGILSRTSFSLLVDVLFLGLTQSHSHWQKRATLANEYARELRHC